MVGIVTRDTDLPETFGVKFFEVLPRVIYHQVY